MAWHMVYTGERYACAWEEWDPATMGALKASLRSSGFQVLSFLSAPLLIFCLRFLHTTGRSMSPCSKKTFLKKLNDSGKCLEIKTKSSTKMCMHNIIAAM